MTIEMQEKAFRNVILPLKDKFYRLALRITLDSAEAEDIVQDTLIRIWEKRDEWPSVESFEALGLTICRNLAIDRSQRKEAQNVELIPEQMDAPQTSGPHEMAVANESMELIRRLIDGLPPPAERSAPVARHRRPPLPGNRSGPARHGRPSENNPLPGAASPAETI